MANALLFSDRELEFGVWSAFVLQIVSPKFNTALSCLFCFAKQAALSREGRELKEEIFGSAGR
jgi:hypothetical protein